MKKIIIYLSSIIFLLNSILIFSINVYASETVPSEYIARAHGTSFSSLQWNYDNVKKYYIIYNPEGIEPSILTSPQYFYTADKKTFFTVNGGDLIQLILTRGLNIIFEPQKASAFILAFFNSIKNPIEVNGYYVQSGVYDANRNFLGYALNDISGCYYEGIELPENTPALDIPSYQVNNVKNFYDYYNQGQIPDYINVVCPSNETVLNKLDTSPYFDTELIKEFYTNLSSQYNNLFSVPFTITNNHIDKINYVNYNPSFIVSDSSLYISTDSTRYNNMCYYMGLTPEDNNLLFTECVAKYSNMGTNYILFKPYDVQGNALNSTTITYTLNGNQQITGNNYLRVGRDNIHNTYKLIYPGGKDFTIYKSYQIYQNINVNQTYVPQGYTGTNYYNYDSHNDNSIKTTITQIDNSVTTNETIYDTVTDDYYNNVENNTVNNESITNITNTTINNYYPSESNSDNPSNPDNPSDPDNPIEDDSILDAILAALRRFFDVIGRIIGTVLAGLLEVIDSILESIAGIMDGLGGITEFIGSLFSWIPSPVPQILGVGISICILAAIFKFIRG